jgi:outer membrane protein OmpA-like peptidoglycan-associated protein
MESIMDVVGLAWKGDSVERLSSQIQETQTATRKGLESAVPLSMAGLASLFSSEEHASELLGSFKKGKFPHVDPSEIGSLVSDPAATTQLAQSAKAFLARVFGSRLDSVLEALAGQSGVSRSSATTLLGLSAPLVLGAVEKETEVRHLDAQGLSKFLSEEGRKASGLLPTPLSNVLGKVTRDSEFGSLGRKLVYSERAFESHSYDTPTVPALPAMAPPPMPRVGPPPLPSERRRAELAAAKSETLPATAEPTRRSPLWWLLVPLALFALFALFRMGRSERRPLLEPADRVGQPIEAQPGSRERSFVPAPEAASRAASESAQQPQAIGEAPSVEARRATTEVPAARGPEQAVAASPNAAAMEPQVTPPAPAAEAVAGRVQPETHVVYFDTGSDQLHGRSVLRQVAATLVAHPAAKVRVRGYADSRGAEGNNQTLSEERATAVKDYLVAHGVSPDRIDTSARGAEETLPSDSASRRVELVVER